MSTTSRSFFVHVRWRRNEDVLSTTELTMTLLELMQISFVKWVKTDKKTNG